MLCTVDISFKVEGEIDFLRQKFSVLVANRSALQEMLKIFHREGKWYVRKSDLHKEKHWRKSKQRENNTSISLREIEKSKRWQFVQNDNRNILFKYVCMCVQLFINEMNDSKVTMDSGS